MSSWVPLRTAPPEPLCPPSTSYAAPGLAISSTRLRERRCGGHSHRGRALQRIRCHASQALQSYHNAFKLLHQPARTAEPSVAPTPDAAPSLQQEQQQQQASQSRPPQATAAVRPVAPLEPSLPGGQAAQQRKFAGGRQRGARASTNSSPSAYTQNTDASTSTSSSSVSATAAPGSNANGSSGGAPGGLSLHVEGLRPYVPHSVSLPAWEPPPTSLQLRTALTRAITTCTSYTRLHQLILDNAADFNCYHTCAALSRVLALHGAGLTPRESRLFKEGCSTLQTILRRQLPELQPRSLVVAAYSLARLELPDRELLAGLAAAVEPHLNALQPQGLSSLMWAFARQNHQPPPKWMDAMLSAVAADLAAFSPRDMATVIWALARLHYKVAPARLKQLLEYAQASMGSFCGRSLSNVVYSLGLSEQHPGEEWLLAAQARAVALGPDGFTPQGMTQMAWGLAKLGAAPTPAFLGLLMEHASQRLPMVPQDRLREREQQGGEPSGAQRRQGRYSGLDLSTLLYSLASLGAQPRAKLGRRLLAAVQWELPTLEANGMCNCLWACARLQLYPHRTWISAFFDASYRQLPYFKPVDLSQTLWALARLQAQPPSAWMSLVMTRLQHSASMFSPVEVANTMWALARLGVRGEAMSGEVLALFFIATDRRLSSFKHQELSSMIWALAHMRRRPDKEWTSEFLKVTYHKLATMNGWCLATLAWSLAELSLLPPPAWVYNYVNAARALMNASPPQPEPPSLSPSQLQPLPQQPRRVALGGVTAPDPGAEVASGLSAMDLGQIITALRRLNGSGSGSSGLAKVDEFLAEAEQRLTAMEAGSGAYARQQLGAFLAMSPRQAGLRAAVPEPSHMTISEPSGNIRDEAGAGASGCGDAGSGTTAVATAAAAAAVGGQKGARTNRRRQQTSAVAAMLEQQPAPQHSGDKKPRRAAGTGRLVAAGSARAGGGGVRGAGDGLRGESSSTSLGTDGVVSSAAAAGVGPREVTRVLSGGARVTLAAPPDVHVDLDLDLDLGLGGELNIELPGSQSGPVLWRSAAAAPGSAAAASPGLGSGGNGDGNGIGNNGGSGELGEDAASNLAEIKRRLLAV